MDRFSKSCRLIPLPGMPTAMDTAECMFNYVFRYYGLPEDLVSDRGSQFTSRIWRAFFKHLGVTVSLSSGYHPQTNGQTERKIQEIGRFLRTFCHSQQDSWSQFLGWAEYAQTSLHQPTTCLPVRTRLPTPTVPLGWGAIGHTGSGLLVPGEREGLGLGSSGAPASPTQA
ncbi:hypothetical protein QTP86_005041 [Hemibagrus guttatus]|nr:hypothetical protein QTP86_005041 [Hemibagrus guttatus]